MEQQTLHFDPVTGTTSLLRDKENAPDYRYFPDPDLPPVLLSADQIDQIAAAFPDRVSEYRKGKKGLLGFFMGEVMKRSKGKADPKMTTVLLQKKLG